ncbi:MAG: cytochrome c [Balneolaceae bacterium]|nr:cytochrome c [Balneolaceae bacterium]
MIRYRHTILALAIGFALVAFSCTGRSSTQDRAKESTIEGRWFTRHQFETGREVFQTHCTSCHGAKAQGIVKDWRQRNPDGSFPPPPLDGSAHAWHHPMEVLVRQINEGGIKLGGTMPAFGDSLSHGEVIAAIAYFQSFWDGQTYDRWIRMNADS